MPVLDVNAFYAALPIRGRLLGLDLGDKTIGLALSDPARQVASALETVTRRKFTADAQALARVCQSYEVTGLVLGLPINMDGSEGRRCQITRQFAHNLMKIHGMTLPITFWDERLSTAAVERILVGEADMSRQRRGAVVDKLAASYILQGTLDAMRAPSPAPDP